MTVLSRREWLRNSGFALGGGLGVSWAHNALAHDFGPWRRPDRREAMSPGEYGVASGDPDHDGFTIWTRLPDKIIAALFGQNENPSPFLLRYWVALRPGESDSPIIVRSGEAICSPERDYTAKATLRGLEAGQAYIYGFECGDLWGSEVGHARTLPSRDAHLDVLRFAYFSCQLYGTGYYTAYQALSQDDTVDFCVHLGDSIYESVGELYKFVNVREDPVGTAFTRQEYRALHRKGLGDLWYREARRRFTWICIPDDHEVANNYLGSDPTTFERQREGMTAYWEYMPIGDIPNLEETNPLPPQIPYRRFAFGRLATLYALNERQFRDPPGSPQSSMLGSEQCDWLRSDLESLSGSNSSDFPRWQVLLSEVLMMPFSAPLRPKRLPKAPLEALMPQHVFRDSAPESPRGGAPLESEEMGAPSLSAAYIDGNDSWDGYANEREIILESALGAQNDQSRLLVWTGDVHNLYAGDVHLPDGRKAAVEVTTGSISSTGVGDIFLFGTHKIVEGAVMRNNPHMKAINLKQHMYMRCTLTPNSACFESICPTTVRQPSASFGLVDQMIVEHKTHELRRVSN